MDMSRILGICLAGLVLAACDLRSERPPEPLSHAEWEAVVKEVSGFMEAAANGVDYVHLQDATPARIDRLLSMAAVTTLPADVRIHALSLSGKGAILKFEKPSDVVLKFSSWFPDKMADARATPVGQIRQFPDSLGPFSDWNDEAIAFITLWRCMPQIAWLEPQSNPFQRRLNDNSRLMQPGVIASASHDFAKCIYDYSGMRTENHREGVLQSADIGRKVMPLLVDKIRRFLASGRCGGTGPDDCVLNLWIWFSLSPNDPVLARMIRDLEPLVGLDRALPPLKYPLESYGPGSQEGEPHFDEALRRAAFLRTKIGSIKAVPEEWGGDSLSKALRQLSVMQAWFSKNVDYRRHEYALRNNEHLDPWKIIARWSLPENVVYEELDALDADTDCEVTNQWFQHGGRWVATRYFLRHLDRPLMRRCVNPDWSGLSEGGEFAPVLRNQFVDALESLKDGLVHDQILTGLTDNGQACFEQYRPEWISSLCSSWMSAPMEISKRLARKLQVGPEKTFRAVVDVSTDEVVSEITSKLKRDGIAITDIRKWVPPKGYRAPQAPKMLLELELMDVTNSADAYRWSGQQRRVLAMVWSDRNTIVTVPQRFSYQYDEGSISKITDIDEDGNPEIWFSGTYGECDGDNLRPGIDCSIESIHMGEVFHDAVSYFSDQRVRQNPNASR